MKNRNDVLQWYYKGITMCYREMYFTESELDFRQKESTEHYFSVLNCVLYLEYCTGQNT